MPSSAGSSTCARARAAASRARSATGRSASPDHNVVPRPSRAAAILREDREYVQALLERGADAKLPLARRSATQRRVHAENVERV